MPIATLLLPPAARFGGGALPAGVASALARADRSRGEAGERGQLRRHFQLIPDHWPVAALTRNLDAKDAAGAAWLRADPCFIHPDLNGARMLSHGDALGLTAEDAQHLLPALQPLFGDAGFPIDAPHPARWYLRLPPEARLPEFAAVADVLGDDLFAHLPDGDTGRRWRALLTEAQVILHAHPWNARRLQQGKPSVNSLWFWGAGTLPDFVRTEFKQVKGTEPLLRALAKLAGVGGGTVGEDVDALVDLRALRSIDILCREVLQPLLAEVAQGRLDALNLDFEDGGLFVIRHAQRWRFWRKPLPALGA